MCDLGFGIQDDHDHNTGTQILCDLVEDLDPAIVLRANLDNEIGYIGPISRGQLAIRKSSLALIGDGSSAHAIGSTLGDHA
jgi:hypothetical protein